MFLGGLRIYNELGALGIYEIKPWHIFCPMHIEIILYIAGGISKVELSPSLYGGFYTLKGMGISYQSLEIYAKSGEGGGIVIKMPENSSALLYVFSSTSWSFTQHSEMPSGYTQVPWQ